MTASSFIIDLGYTMLRSPGSNPNGEAAQDCQMLHCKCGYEHIFNDKIKCSVVLYMRGRLDNGKGLESIQCPKCKRKYPEVEKPHLLEPGKEKLVHVAYKTSKGLNNNGNLIHTITRIRKYAYYDFNSKVFDFKYVNDYIQFNEYTKRSTLFIDNTKWKDEAYLNSQEIPQEIPQELKSSNISISHLVDISNLISINKFFGHLSHVEYVGLEEVFLFFKNLDYNIRDIEKIKSIPLIAEIYNSYKIISETISDSYGGSKITYYRMLDDGFGQDTLEKTLLSASEYLESLIEIARTFFAIMSFSNITTILLTKDYFFFNEFLKSSLVCNSNVYKNYRATSPNKILEISANFSKSGKIKFPIKKLNENNYLKISNIIYNHIRRPNDITYILNIFLTKIINKTEIESLFQTYGTEDVYRMFYVFCKNYSNKKIKLGIKNIKQVLKYKLDIDYPNKRFWEEYIDTLSVIQQIVDSKKQVAEYIKENQHNISKEDKSFLIDYLKVKSSIIFEVKTQKKLKKMHDELSILHSVFKDSSKNAAYKEAIDNMDYLNQEINGVNFTIIPSAKEMHVEHNIMSHCVNTYIDRVIELSQIILRVRDSISNERATLSCLRNNGELTFSQLKGYQNSRATKNLIDTVLEYCKINNILIRKDNNFSLDLQSNKNEEKKMPDYITDEEILLIKRKKLGIKITKHNSPLSTSQANSIIEKFKNQF